MNELLSLNERVAVVTGGSRGIGRAVALELAHRGAAVVVNYNKSPEAAEAVVSEIKAAGGRSVSFQADVSEPAAAQNLIKFAVESFGDLHILVNNAGITRDTVIMLMSELDWDSVLDANLKSTFNCSKAAVKHMMRKRYGRIVSISSVSGQMGNAGQTNYSASKAGVIGLTRALALELGKYNVAVNAVAPGLIDTPLTQKIKKEALDKLIEAQPTKTMGKPEDVANMVSFLASEKTNFITGQTLYVDGGKSI